MRILLDEHLSPSLAEELRRRGHDVVAAIEVGQRGQPDPAVLSWAVGQGRALVTANYADFLALHEVYLSRGEHHLGIVLISRRLSLSEAGFGRLITALDEFLKTHPEERAMEDVETWLTG